MNRQVGEVRVHSERKKAGHMQDRTSILFFPLGLLAVLEHVRTLWVLKQEKGKPWRNRDTFLFRVSHM